MFLARQVSAVVAKQLKQEAEKLTEERLSHSVETTYGIYNRKIEGLETYIALLEKNFKSYSTSNKPRGRAGWGFFKSAEYDGRGSFLPQHSCLEMTNGKSMNFMQSLMHFFLQYIEASCTSLGLTDLNIAQWFNG